MKNTPDYYAILNVQAGASLQEIKASYRRLMIALKKHPDLGGDHGFAAQINEAYKVLSDDEKRKEYARSVHTVKPQIASGRNPRSPSAPAKRATVRHCLLCGRLSIQPLVGSDTRCRFCRSPLSPPPTVEQLEREVGGRRLTLRASKSNSGTIYPPGMPRGLTVNMRDLSLTGMSFYSPISIEAGQVLRFRDLTLDAVIAIVSCRGRGGKYSIHARLLTVAFELKEGVFVSTTG